MRRSCTGSLAFSISRMPAFIRAFCSAVNNFCLLRRRSSSSSNRLWASRRVFCTSSAASILARSISCFASFSARSRSASASFSMFCAFKRSCSALSRSSSILRRLSSKRETTSSNIVLSSETSSFACSTMFAGIPRRAEMANALERPGTPMSRRYVGRSVATSNSQQAFSTPTV